MRSARWTLLLFCALDLGRWSIPALFFDLTRSTSLSVSIPACWASKRPPKPRLDHDRSKDRNGRRPLGDAAPTFPASEGVSKCTPPRHDHNQFGSHHHYHARPTRPLGNNSIDPVVVLLRLLSSVVDWPVGYLSTHRLRHPTPQQSEQVRRRAHTQRRCSSGSPPPRSSAGPASRPPPASAAATCVPDAMHRAGQQ